LTSITYFLIGECYRSSEKYDEAIFFYSKAKEVKGVDSIKYDFSWFAEYNIAVCLIFQQNFEKASSQLNKLNEVIQSFDIEKRKLPEFLNQFLSLILHVAEKEYSDAGNVLSTIDKQYLNEFTCVHIDEYDLIKFKDLPSRNVGLSVIMSTLVPGLGQLYTNRPLEALTSILLTGVFTFIAYEAFTENQVILGVVSAFLATSFYFANIYNAANSAISFNENRRIEYYNRLINRLDADVLHFFLIPEETDEGLTFTFRVLR
jgi:tetratricopeptide (TPR) repeat protein